MVLYTSSDSYTGSRKGAQVAKSFSFAVKDNIYFILTKIQWAFYHINVSLVKQISKLEVCFSRLLGEE